MSLRLFNSKFKKEFIIVLSFISLYAIFRLLGITCLIYKITDIPCPACNMARALVALIKGDFDTYVSYNIMALPVAIVFLVGLFENVLGRYKGIVRFCCAVILIINLLYYLSRLESIV